MEVQCPGANCDVTLRGPKRLIGHRTRCPSCGHVFFWAEHFYPSDTFVIYDLETTGLHPESDEFIQIAAVRYHAGCLCPRDAFFSFARPRQPISSFIEDYTGIGNHHVKGAQRPEVVLKQFAAWSGDATLIAHNGKRFDGKFLEATCRRHNMASREVLCIDSINISKMVFGRTRGTGHSLDHIKQRLALRETNLRRHDARGDVDILGRAVEEMHRRLGLDTALNGVPRHTTRLPYH